MDTKNPVQIAYLEFEIAGDAWSAGGFIGNTAKEQAARRLWAAYEKLVDELDLKSSLTSREINNAISAGSYLGKYL